jgi:hypothetical protein
MSAEDWADLDDSLVGVEKGATNGLGVPNGGGTQIYAFNSMDAEQIGAAGLRCVIADFQPMSSGGRISGCIKRLQSGANTGFSPLFYLASGGMSVADNAYLLGLEDADPYRIVLRKATIQSGIPQTAEGNYLARSSSQFNMSDDLWHHLRLDVIVQPSGAVTLEVAQNNLTANPCTSPIWESIPGMAQFVDDAVGANTGTLPLIGGYAGFATAYSQSIATRGGFDQIQILRQAT